MSPDCNKSNARHDLNIRIMKYNKLLMVNFKRELTDIVSVSLLQNTPNYLKCIGQRNIRIGPQLVRQLNHARALLISELPMRFQ